MYPIAALYLAKIEPQDLEAVDVYQNHLDLASQEHTKDINQLKELNSNAVNLNPLFFASTHSSGSRSAG